MKRFCLLLFVLFAAQPFAEELDAATVAKHVWERADGAFVTRQLSMDLIDPQGKTLSREAEVLRGTWQGVKKTRIVFTAPRRVKNTAFLTYDYLDEVQTDEQWMYLPALRRERRIPASDRGDNFMGSEFSYEDIKSELKFPLYDYNFEKVSQQENGFLLRGVPNTPELAAELGYGRFEALINLTTWLPEKIDFWDLKSQPLKTVLVSKAQQIEGFWVATDLRVENHQTQHKSHFFYTDVSYQGGFNPQLFNVSALRAK